MGLFSRTKYDKHKVALYLILKSTFGLSTTNLLYLFYILDKEYKIKTGVKFKRWFHGFYSRDVTDILFDLEERGLIEQTRRKNEYHEWLYAVKAEYLDQIKHEVKDISQFDELFSNLANMPLIIMMDKVDKLNQRRLGWLHI
ncbi:hypothetical protein [Sulfuracidifex metallicus]|uniref:Uncharacterized protein n=1 Tax=Sulfuracidifex metallicus DSM 6482 = JCM 9184 TaxID=523847 RepID=A0A6A9QMW7_SULME|nr:hypothetical protein [Sulfuracidifex metallicus]MUN29650.1 hypothetical protein [Sulfuracidifex metallicus DSM 6482 = JCM 9184]WOE49843.1 hypothetical protein RQ359_001326 [Sulfuracidifex metallicus DSM 6482 = JCM 9184]